jgi:hypothetical protein
MAYGREAILTELGRVVLESKNLQGYIKIKAFFMKKKKVITKERDTSLVIYSSNRIRVSKELNNQLFFEIENELTSDLAEAIAIFINFGINDSEFLKTSFNIDTNNISPDKTLYWLSGGDKEWATKQNYNKSWSEVYLSYQEEYGMLIINIINKAKTFGDIKNEFIKKLNLPTLYEFSLEKGYLK